MAQLQELSAKLRKLGEKVVIEIGRERSVLQLIETRFELLNRAWRICRPYHATTLYSRRSTAPAEPLLRVAVAARADILDCLEAVLVH